MSKDSADSVEVAETAKSLDVASDIDELEVGEVDGSGVVVGAVSAVLILLTGCSVDGLQAVKLAIAMKLSVGRTKRENENLESMDLPRDEWRFSRVTQL